MDLKELDGLEEFDGLDQDSMAEARTALSEDRTLLANERTFAGWLRTGLASIGIGLAFNVLFRSMEPAWIPRAIATVFLLIAMLIVLAAERRARAVMTRLRAHVLVTARRMNLPLLAWPTVGATAALIVAIWLAPIR